MLTRDFFRNKYIYLMALPVLAYYIIFYYGPMYGAIIAFKSYSPGLGILGSEWVGLDNFRSFFSSVYFGRVIRNTIIINFYSLLLGFPAPIILALLFNEIKNDIFKRAVQTVSYLPHFISIMVVCGMIIDFTARDGVVNDIISWFGGERVNLMIKPEFFRTIYVGSGIWQEVGWGSIIYLAAIASIDPQLYEAAIIDGAGRWRQLLNITLPGIMATIVILLILRVGQMMSVGYEKIILLYNPNTYETADVISSFVYRKGLLQFDYSYSSAVGLFNSAINFFLLISTNWISRKLNETSLW
jgi:putative aldouronate transport system permease protein